MVNLVATNKKLIKRQKKIKELLSYEKNLFSYRFCWIHRFHLTKKLLSAGFKVIGIDALTNLL